MKKNLLFLLCFALFAGKQSRAQFTVTDLGLEVQHADISAVDLDNDGDLDIVISGQLNMLGVYKNNGGTFTLDPSTPFQGLTFATMDWGDINGDGKLDMLQNGFPDGQPPITRLYTSDGAGNFTASSTVLPQLTPSSGFADLNNDGYTDMFIFGNYFDGKCKILFNDKNGGFTESAQFDAYNWIDPNVTLVDYDNDKDLDLFVNAYDDIAHTRFAKMFKNDNGTFTETNINIIQKSYGSAVWGDYNSDGYLDLLLNGDGDAASGEDNNNIYRLYSNVNGVFTAVQTFSTYRQISTGDGGRFADIDNDGDLDIIVTGYSEDLQTQATAIYINTPAHLHLLHSIALFRVCQKAL